MLTFAESFFERQPVESYGIYPSLELGLAGICLDPEHGYVFVTFVYHDGDGVLRNNVVRFTSAPGTFSVSPASRVDFRRIFESDRSNVSHQIGPCQVGDGVLYVSVGDGKQQGRSQSLRSTLGKILRLTVDGEPVPDNPFFEDDGRDTPADFVWASGLQKRVRAEAGRGCAARRRQRTRDGSAAEGRRRRELSVGRVRARAWEPRRSWSSRRARGLAQMDYSPPDSSVPGGPWQGVLFQTVSSDTERLRADQPPHILAIEYDLRTRKLLRAPRPFLRYRGDRTQTLTGLALGPDGLYFTAIFPTRSGTSAVYKATYDPGRAHPYPLDENASLPVVLRDGGCLGCHRHGGQGGDSGPVLDRRALLPALEARLSSAAYRRVERTAR